MSLGQLIDHHYLVLWSMHHTGIHYYHMPDYLVRQIRLTIFG